MMSRRMRDRPAERDTRFSGASADREKWVKKHFPCSADHVQDWQPTRLIHTLADAAAELGMDPVSKHHIQPEYRDEQTDAGRDG